jgi:hypothetical protein
MQNSFSPIFSMKRFVPVFAFILASASAACAAYPHGTLTTLHAILSLASAEAREGLPVAFEATVTYCDINGSDLSKLKGLLDAELEVIGAVSGMYDSKMQLSGILPEDSEARKDASGLASHHAHEQGAVRLFFARFDAQSACPGNHHVLSAGFGNRASRRLK